MKNNRHGQAAIISDTDYAKIRKQIKSKKYRLLLDIARYTGERWGAIVQLQVEDVFSSDDKPLENITFRARTRKASPDGRRSTRQVPIHPLLKELLEAVKLQGDDWLFPSRINPESHITLRCADQIFRGAVLAAGLEFKGLSTHSTRRTFITRLYERGTDIHTIQLITGHHDLKALVRYIDADPERTRKAIANL